MSDSQICGFSDVFHRVGRITSADSKVDESVVPPPCQGTAKNPKTSKGRHGGQCGEWRRGTWSSLWECCRLLPGVAARAVDILFTFERWIV